MLNYCCSRIGRCILEWLEESNMGEEVRWARAWVLAKAHGAWSWELGRGRRWSWHSAPPPRFKIAGIIIGS